MAYSVSDFRRDIRAPYAWPGGYPRIALRGENTCLVDISQSLAVSHMRLCVSV